MIFVIIISPPQKNTEIHFLKIDVEGFEEEVLLGFDLNKYRPWIIAIEAIDPSTRTPSEEKWEAYLLENMYFLAYQYGLNRYYVREESRDLSSKFISVEELCEIYELYTIRKWSVERKNIYFLVGQIVLSPAKLFYVLYKKVADTFRR